MSNITEETRQWAIRIKEWRDSEKYKLDKMDSNEPAWEWQRGRWSVLCDLLSQEFDKKLINKIEEI
jgi:hypothetical protein